MATGVMVEHSPESGLQALVSLLRYGRVSASWHTFKAASRHLLVGAPSKSELPCVNPEFPSVQNHTVRGHGCHSLLKVVSSEITEATNELSLLA